MEIWRTSDVVPFPPRSRYASSEPIGLGTGMVESLTSYITRLRGEELAAVGARHAGGCCPSVSPDEGRERWSLRPVRAFGRDAERSVWHRREAVRILSELTLHTGLRALTLTDLAGLVSHSGLLHSSEHWCPACLEEQRERGLEIGIPLVWQLRAVQICPTHEVPLEHSCPRCGRRHRPLSRHGDSGRCPWCQTWLGGPGRVGAPGGYLTRGSRADRVHGAGVAVSTGATQKARGGLGLRRERTSTVELAGRESGGVCARGRTSRGDRAIVDGGAADTPVGRGSGGGLPVRVARDRPVDSPG